MIQTKTPRVIRALLCLPLMVILTQCGSTGHASKSKPQASTARSDGHRSAFTGTGRTSRGIASFYTVRTNGRRTASGIPFSDSVPTAAHRSLPFGTFVKVTNLRNGRSEIVKITDRGPFIKGRIIDLSLVAANNIGMVGSGIVPVEVEVLRPPGQAS